MQFKNEKHKEEFTQAIKHIDKEDKTMLSVLYLLTADKSLWRKTKNYMRSGYIALNRVRIRRISEDGYTLFCCAKDMLYGTEHMTPNDLADKDLISSRVFILRPMSMKTWLIIYMTLMPDLAEMVRQHE